MKYVLVTHVPTYVGQSPGVVRMTKSFFDDIVAQARALRAVDFDLTLATPRHAEPDERTIARERFIDVRPDDCGFRYVALAAFKTMPQFATAQFRLKSAIVTATHDASVVQTGAGGHPMALGQFAWPLLDGGRAKRVFVFADDPVPARQRHVTSGRNPAKRLGKRLAVRRFAAFCRTAVREADLVFAHDPAVAKRLSRDWSARCHTFAASGIGDADLATESAAAARALRLADPKRPLRVIAVAAKEATAGVDHLLRAVAKARRLNASVTLTLSGPLPASAAALLGELNLAGVTRVGAAAPAWGEGDVFIAAPLVPGETQAIFSAAAAGLPIVTYRAGATDASLAAAGGGVGVDRGETDRLAQALLDLCRDRPRLATMASLARLWAAGCTRDSVHRRRAELVRNVVKP